MGYDSLKYDTSGKSLWTRFVQGLNTLLNPNHAWYDYSTWKDSEQGGLDNWLAGATGSGLTAAQKAANQFSSEEAEKQRAWETEMQNTAYQRQVKDMQAAGINPALAMSNGQPSTPSGASAQSVASGSAMSMSELMQALLLPAQAKLIRAQANATDAGAAKSRAEIGEIEGRTEQLRLLNKYYPEVTDTTIEKMKKELGLTDEKINTERLQQDILRVEKMLKDSESKYAERFYKARAEFEEAKDEESKASAAASAARAAWDEYETQYAKSHNGARPSSSAVLALVTAVSSWLGVGEDGTLTNAIADGVKDKLREYGGLVEDPFGTITEKGAEYDEKLRRVGDGLRRFGRSVKSAVKRSYRRSRSNYGLK